MSLIFSIALSRDRLNDDVGWIYFEGVFYWELILDSGHIGAGGGNLPLITDILTELGVWL